MPSAPTLPRPSPDKAAAEEPPAEEASESAPANRQGYRRLLSALRATGLPEAEVHRILRGAALADWQDDVRRIQGNASGGDEFWKSRSLPYGMDAASRRQVVELRRAREAALSEVIGDRESIDPWSVYVGQPRWGIPADKRRAVIMLEEDYELLMAETAMANELNLPADREALRLLQQERLEDLAAILSPDELEEYELRHSETADALRQDLRFFDASEEEFRELFRLHYVLDTEFPRLSSPPDHRRAAEEALEEELRKLMGETRFADYQRVQDPEFQQLAEVTDRLGLSAERAAEVYDFKRLIEEKHLELSGDDELTREDRREAGQLLADEARQVVREALGERGYETYLENGGWWLRILEENFPERADEAGPD